MVQGTHSAPLKSVAGLIDRWGCSRLGKASRPRRKVFSSGFTGPWRSSCRMNTNPGGILCHRGRDPVAGPKPLQKGVGRLQEGQLRLARHPAQCRIVMRKHQEAGDQRAVPAGEYSRAGIAELLKQRQRHLLRRSVFRVHQRYQPKLPPPSDSGPTPGDHPQKPWRCCARSAEGTGRAAAPAPGHGSAQHSRSRVHRR